MLQQMEEKVGQRNLRLQSPYPVGLTSYLESSTNSMRENCGKCLLLFLILCTHNLTIPSLLYGVGFPIFPPVSSADCSISMSITITTVLAHRRKKKKKKKKKKKRVKNKAKGGFMQQTNRKKREDRRTQ